MIYLDSIKDKVFTAQFSKKGVEPEKVKLVLKAGGKAETTNNLMPQRIMLLEGGSSAQKLLPCLKTIVESPMSLLVCYDNVVSWKNPGSGMDAGLTDVEQVVRGMTCALYNLGLCVYYNKDFYQKRLRETFNIPGNITPVVVLHVGYPAKLEFISDYVCSDAEGVNGWIRFKGIFPGRHANYPK